MHLVLSQVLLVYIFQVANFATQVFFVVPLLLYFKIIFASFRNEQFKPAKKKDFLSKNIFRFFEWLIFFILVLNIVMSSNKKIVSMAMFGWDFVGHFGVFRWGLNHFRMISSQEILNSKSLESFLDSDYPQTYDLWGANYFRLLDFDTFGIIKAMLVFALATLFLSYVIFIKTYTDLLNENIDKNMVIRSKSKTWIYRFTFIFLVLQFLSFCWSTNCPHFALSTALIFRATILSTNRFSKSNQFEVAILLLIAYVLYPLTIICAGLLVVNRISKLVDFPHAFGKYLGNIENFVFFSVLLAITSSVVFKNGRAIPLLEMLQSYGGVDFPAKFLIVIMLVMASLFFYFVKTKFDVLKFLSFLMPVLLIDIFLIFSQGFISYYGAKASISFLTIALGYLILNLNFDSQRKIVAPWFFTILISISILILNQAKAIQPTFHSVLSRGFPTSFTRFFTEIELKNGWASGSNVAGLLQRLEADPKEFPLITGGYPYLGNQWLIQAGRYPSEIWLGKIDFNGQLYNPIYFVSRDLNTKEKEAFLTKFPYITLVRNE